jgi:hypothetical protein
MRLLCVPAVVVLLATATAAPASAQGPAYPNVDKPYAFAGDTVRLLSRIVSDMAPAAAAPGRRLDFVYSTAIPAANRNARAAQADRAAQAFGAEAIEIGAQRISIGICDTPQCAQRKHPPAEWYLYERTASGWRRVR